MVNQHHHGFVGDRIARGAPHIADSFTGSGADNGAFVEPLAGDVHAGLEQAAWIAAQIQHIALSSLRFKILDGRTHLTRGVGIELLKTDVAHLAAVGRCVEHGFHGMNLNPRPFQRHIQHLTLAPESQHHIGALRASDQLDGVLGGHAFGGGTINGDNHILGLNARTGCRGALNRGDNNQLLRVFVETELDPHAHQLTGGVDLHFLEFLRIKETRVGIIKAGQHAADRLVGLGAAPIRLAEQIAPQLAPRSFVVGTRRIQVIAINDLPDLINHLLGAVVDGSAGGRWQGEAR